MAIYSLNVKSVGKSTHAPGTAGAHVRYISRDRAEPDILADHMPEDPNKARAYMDLAEDGDRKNARICDKIRIAIPRELSDDERRALVQEFCRDVTDAQVPFFAAIHQSGKDAHNPHAHIIIRDRHIETGKRVLKWSDNKRDREKAGLPVNAVDHIRERWEHCANDALEKVGHDARIDRRTLNDQGIDRIPTIHIGPNAKHIEDTVQRPDSKNRGENAWWRSYRDEIPYEFIDAGRTRQERNAEIIDLNLERSTRSRDFATRERAKLQKELVQKERVLERRLVAQARQHTFEQRQVRADYRTQWVEARNFAKDEESAVRQDLASRWKQSRSDLRDRHDAERSELKASHSTLKARVWRVMDFTGRTRARQNEERDTLKSTHAAERRDLVQSHNDTKQVQLDLVQSRHDPILKDIQAAHTRAQKALEDKHAPALADAEKERQLQEQERERDERRLESALRQLEQQQKRQRDQQHQPRMR